MIVSHRHKFVYVRTQKTASSSLILSLLPHLGKDDVCIPVNGRGKNWNPEWSKEFEHWPVEAAITKGFLDRVAMTEYTVWTVERNPWDKTVSHYLYHKNHDFMKPPIRSFRDYIDRGNYPSDFWRYCYKGNMVCDWVGRYENLSEVEQFLGKLMSRDFRIEHKEKVAEDRKPYQDYYDPHSLRRIGVAFAQERRAFGYDYGD